MPDPNPLSLSRVERYFLQRSPVPFLPRSEERIPVLTVANYVELGQVTALRSGHLASRCCLNTVSAGVSSARCA